MDSGKYVWLFGPGFRWLRWIPLLAALIGCVSVSAIQCSICKSGADTDFDVRIRSGLTRGLNDAIPGNSNFRKIPGKMDNLYKYNVNSESDLVTFTDVKGEPRQALTYYNGKRRMTIVSRSFPVGDWDAPVDIHQAVMREEEVAYDSHNTTALGVAPDGTMIAVGNHHRSELNMARTVRPTDIQSFTRVNPVSVNALAGKHRGSDADRVTYPAFFHLNGHLWFSYREQEVGGGNPRFRWILKRYDHETGIWDQTVNLNTGVHLRLYVSNIAWNAENDQVHLAAVWRDDSFKGARQWPGPASQHDLFHMYSNDGMRWKQLGVPESVSLPLLWNEGGSNFNSSVEKGGLVPELIWNTPPEPVPSNAGSIAVDQSGNPHILNDEYQGPLWHHTYREGHWRSRPLSVKSHSDDLFPVGSTVGAIIHKGKKVWYYSIDSLRNDGSGILLAEGYTNKNYQVSIDRTAVDAGWLSVMLTSSGHGAPGSVFGSSPRDAWVMSIPLKDLDSFDSPFVH